MVLVNVYIDGIKIVVQAKRQERPVGINAVQEVVSIITQLIKE